MIQTTKYPYIAFLAGIFTVLGFSHLIYNVYLTKKTEHFTFLWIFFFNNISFIIINLWFIE